MDWTKKELIALINDIKFSYTVTGGIMPQEIKRMNDAINSLNQAEPEPLTNNKQTQERLRCQECNVVLDENESEICEDCLCLERP